jgi:hypothetical protein
VTKQDQLHRVRPRALSRARNHLEKRVSEMLARPIEQLQSRGWLPPALGGFSSMPITREAHGLRMREILERDRALVEAAPVETPTPEVHPFEIRMHDESDAQVTPATPPTHELHATAANETSPPPAKLETPAKPRKQAVCSEPIRTRTMAKLLLSQGHGDRALSIYEALIAAGSTDPLVHAEADELRSLQT